MGRLPSCSQEAGSLRPYRCQSRIHWHIASCADLQPNVTPGKMEWRQERFWFEREKTPSWPPPPPTHTPSHCVSPIVSLRFAPRGAFFITHPAVGWVSNLHSLNGDGRGLAWDLAHKEKGCGTKLPGGEGRRDRNRKSGTDRDIVTELCFCFFEGLVNIILENIYSWTQVMVNSNNCQLLLPFLISKLRFIQY